MTEPKSFSFRSLASGMGQAVAERTILRKKETGEYENWGDVADRVSYGNSSLFNGPIHTSESEYLLLRKHIANGNTLMSGRHLQHGDATQSERSQECFTNCSTSSVSFGLFLLLLSGSGVGRCYDDDLMLVDWDFAPNLRCVLDASHTDFDYSAHESLRDARHKYGTGSDTLWFKVPDTREGWAKALELWENAAFEKIHKDKMLILDFSNIRPKGSPIGGMQNRPASGPVALINAFNKAASLKGSGLERWRQAMYVDHYFAECVLVGGARRAARMSTKHWSDKTIFDFITIKRPIEYKSLSVEKILEMRKNDPNPPYGFLWSSNNSVTVDDEFWTLVGDKKNKSDLAKHAKKVFNLICASAYGDGTGEPGIINSHKLVRKDEGWTDLNRGDYIGSKKYQVNDDTQIFLSKLAKHAKKKKYNMIVNPCVPGETPILTRNGYFPIKELVGTPVDIWNGKEWATVTPFSTGINPIVTVVFDDGTKLRCTPYHRFILRNGQRVEAHHLVATDAIAKFPMPVVEFGIDYDDDAYSQGFYSGDGCENLSTSWIYEPKFCCEHRLIGKIGNIQTAVVRKFWNHGQMREKTWVPINGTKNYCFDWFAGLCDADGCVTREKNGNGIQIVSVNRAFLENVRLMLTRLGVCAKVVDGDPHRIENIKGKNYQCQENFRLLVGNTDTYHLVKSGLKTERLHLHSNPPQRDARRFVRVVHVLEDDISEETFCFKEPLNGTGTFNGIVTAQCGEIPLNVLAGFCVISDVVPYHCETLDEAEECFRVVTRALMRVNLMDSIYNKEVLRTNRIGVGMTGIHEFAWKFFRYGFRDLIDEEKSKDFWLTLARFNRAIRDEAGSYAQELGTKIPHTMTTIKPAGTTSKLFLLTEGWHLPSMREFLRWVQFRSDDPLVKIYKSNGYPTRELVQYTGTTIVGFPTAPTITTLGMGDKLVTAAEATPEEQFKWLMLGEKYWIHGTNEEGMPVEENYGGQISYTLKYKPDLIDFDHFKKMIAKYQSQVRCASVMPQSDATSYEYQPEQAVTKAEYEDILNKVINSFAAKSAGVIKEDVGREHVDCLSGACPIDFKSAAI